MSEEERCQFCITNLLTPKNLLCCQIPIENCLLFNNLTDIKKFSNLGAHKV